MGTYKDDHVLGVRRGKRFFEDTRPMTEYLERDTRYVTVPDLEVIEHLAVLLRGL